MEYGYPQTTDLYLQDCGVKRCEATKTMCCPVCSEYVLNFVTDGKGSLHTEHQSFPLRKGQMFLLNPGERNYGISAKGWGSLSYMWASFNGGIAKSLVERIGLFSSQPVCTLPVPLENVTDMMKKLVKTQGGTLPDEIRRVGYLYRLLSILLASQQPVRQKRTVHEYSSKTYALYAREYLKNNYSHTTITELAGRIGIDRSYLHHVFKKYFHMSPQEYLISLRLEAAAGLLETTKDGISRAALEAGYEDSMQFSKIFKKHYGLSPSQYRDKAAKGRNY